MNAKSIAMGVVAMVVATVLVVTCAVPIISDSVKTEDTFTNEGVYYMSSLESTSTDTYTLSWDHSSPLKITVNDELIELGVPQFFMYSLICADDWIVRYETNSDGTSVTVAYAGAENYAVISASTTASTDITISLDSGTATFTVGETTVTKTYTKSYCIDTAGEYVMKKASSIAYLNGDSDVYIIGVSSWYGATARVKLVGTIDDGFTISVINHDTWTVSDVVTTAPENSNHIDLYDFEKVQFTVDTGSGTQTLTYSQVIVPLEVTADRTYHVDGPTGDILAVIPILMVLGIVIGAVALFLTNRRD